MSLAGQVALVTGSSRRLGRVIALAYAQAGVKVVVNGASDQAEYQAALAAQKT